MYECHAGCARLSVTCDAQQCDKPVRNMVCSRPGPSETEPDKILDRALQANTVAMITLGARALLTRSGLA